MNCIICKKELISYDTAPGTMDGVLIIMNCKFCGTYKVYYPTYTKFKRTDFDLRHQADIRGFLAEHKDFEISDENFDQLINLKTPSFHERANKLLLALEQHTEHAGQYLVKDTKLWTKIAWCINEEELDEILSYLESKTFVHRQKKNDKDVYKIGYDGWSRIEELKEVSIDSNQGFVAMHFDKKNMMSIYQKAISKAICDAGYKPLRVDQDEHTNKIDDKIIVEIRRSRFVVANFTGHRGGCIF